MSSYTPNTHRQEKQYGLGIIERGGVHAGAAVLREFVLGTKLMVREIMPWQASRGTDITVLTSAGTARLTKRIRADAVDPYDAAMYFAVRAYRLAGFEDMVELI